MCIYLYTHTDMSNLIWCWDIQYFFSDIVVEYCFQPCFQPSGMRGFCWYTWSPSFWFTCSPALRFIPRKWRHGRVFAYAMRAGAEAKGGNSKIGKPWTLPPNMVVVFDDFLVFACKMIWDQVKLKYNVNSKCTILGKSLRCFSESTTTNLDQPNFDWRCPTLQWT